MFNKKTKKERVKKIIVIILAMLVIKIGVFPILLDNHKYENQLVIVYEIQAGDTLWDLAKRQAIQGQDIRKIVYDIRQINNPKDLSILQIGDEIMLPVYEEDK